MFILYVLLRVSNKAFHLETDMFSCLISTALKKLLRMYYATQYTVFTKTLLDFKMP